MYQSDVVAGSGEHRATMRIRYRARFTAVRPRALLILLPVALIASSCGGGGRHAMPEPPLVVTRCCYDGSEHIDRGAYRELNTATAVAGLTPNQSRHV